MSININSEAACRKAYLNYHCYGNSMNISADEMGEITKKWESKLNSWQATVSMMRTSMSLMIAIMLIPKKMVKTRRRSNWWKTQYRCRCSSILW